LSPNHLNIADTYKSMGVICYDMKNYDKALECYEKALAIMKISLHSDHPLIAEIYTNIANAYKQSLFTESSKTSHGLHEHWKYLSLFEGLY